MQSIKLNIERRNEVGSGKLNKVRHNGYIPGIIYGKGFDSTPVKIKESDFRNSILRHGKNAVFNTELEKGKVIPVIVKELQYNELKNEYLHVDLQGISLSEKREANVRVRIVGKESAEKKGGILIQQTDTIIVECLPNDVPDYISVDVSKMEVGDSFMVKDLEIPQNVSLISSENEVISSLSEIRSTTEDLNLADDTAADEVPIIGNDERETNAT